MFRARLDQLGVTRSERRHTDHIQIFRSEHLPPITKDIGTCPPLKSFATPLISATSGHELNSFVIRKGIPVSPIQINDLLTQTIPRDLITPTNKTEANNACPKTRTGHFRSLLR